MKNTSFLVEKKYILEYNCVYKIINKRGSIMMKGRRFAQLILAASLVVCLTVSTVAATLSDVGTSHWAYEYVKDLEERGVITLNSKGEFFPNQRLDHFELSDILAKAAGYVDVEVATDVDPALKERIIKYYDDQKATLATYAAKYKNWNKLYDRQVAYLLGEGYIKSSELNQFFTKDSNGKEVVAPVSKQQLAVFIVRVLGKEEIAKKDYTTTGFTDEKLISEANRPHMAYLKKLKIITADEKGASGANTPVTKAMCAKMLSLALEEKEKENNNSESQTSETITVKQVLKKDTAGNEYYIRAEKNGSTSFYTLKSTIKVTDPKGNTVAVADLVGKEAKVTYTVENGTPYIATIQLVKEITNSGNANNDNTNNGSTNDQSTTQSTIVGTVAEVNNNGVLRLKLSDGTMKAYILDTTCTVTLDGVKTDVDALEVGDTVTVTTKGSTIYKIVAKSGVTASTVANGEVLGKKRTVAGYAFTVKQGSAEVVVEVPLNATVKRNNKSADIEQIRLGDQVQFTRTNGKVTAVTVTGNKTIVEGTIQGIYIAKDQQIMVKVNGKVVTYTLAEDVEIYDNNEKEYLTVRGLHLGQTVELILEGKEVINVDVLKVTNSTNYMGKILSIGKDNDYIDVLIDYDPITGENNVVKRIKIASDVNILEGSNSINAKDLEEGMQIVISYKYFDDNKAEKILIIG